MRVSIIIPAYNAERHLTGTLESVLSQTFSDWELVIVDDGSRDGTTTLAEDYAARDGRIRLVRKPNGGVATARNCGLAHLSPSSEFVILLDHDDIWEADALETLVAALDTDPGAVAAHGLALRADPRGRPCGPDPGGILGGDRRRLVRVGRRIRPVACAPDEPTTFAVMAYDGCLCTPGMALVRRRALDGMRLFRQDLAPSDDFDFWVRLSLRGHFAFVNKVVIQWRQHDTNVSKNTRLLADALARNRCHVLNLPELSPEQRALAFWRYRRMYASILRHNAQDCRRWAVEALRQGRAMAAARDLGLSLAYFARYLRLRLFWGEAQDRGALPIRLKDEREMRQRELAAT